MMLCLLPYVMNEPVWLCSFVFLAKKNTDAWIRAKTHLNIVRAEVADPMRWDVGSWNVSRDLPKQICQVALMWEDNCSAVSWLCQTESGHRGSLFTSYIPISNILDVYEAVRKMFSEIYVPDCLNKMIRIDFDVYKNIDAWHIWGDVHRNQTGMAIVHKKGSPQGCGTEVIHTASSISHIAHDETLLHPGKAATQREEDFRETLN